MESQLSSIQEETRKTSDGALVRQNLVIKIPATMKIKKQLIRALIVETALMRLMLTPVPEIMMYMPAMSTFLFRDLFGTLKLP